MKKTILSALLLSCGLLAPTISQAGFLAPDPSFNNPGMNPGWQVSQQWTLSSSTRSGGYVYCSWSKLQPVTMRLANGQTIVIDYKRIYTQTSGYGQCPKPY